MRSSQVFVAIATAAAALLASGSVQAQRKHVVPNAQANQSRDDALRLADMVRVGLSGTLRDYRFTDRFGSVRTNAQIDYFGQQAGFAANPAETINYIEAHDNQTLFDINAFRLPQATPLSDRVRVQTLGAALNELRSGSR